MEQNSQLYITGLSSVMIDVAWQLCETKYCKTTHADFPEYKEYTPSIFFSFFVAIAMNW